MAALKKSLFMLLGGPGNLPPKEELDNYSKDIYYKVMAVDDQKAHVGRRAYITKAEMYMYLCKTSESGISMRSVDKLFARVDLNQDGMITEAEFLQVMRDVHADLSKDKAFEDRMKHGIPENHVVPGSSRMNSLSGTRAFRLQVARRSSMKRLWNVFQEIDLDGDGYVTVAEFKRYIARRQASLSPMSASIYHSLDSNTIGKVSFKRLLERLFPEALQDDIKVLMRMARPKNYIPHSKPDESLMEDIRNVFMVYDDDHSGTLDPEEFAHALQLCGFNEEEASNMFNEVDTGRSGEVSYEEFEAWYCINHTKLTGLLVQGSESDTDHED